MSRRRDTAEFDPTTWPEFDASALTAPQRTTFQARRTAIELYSQGTTGLDIRTPPEGKERCAREAIGGAEPALRTRLPWVPFARAHDLCRPGVLAAFRMDYVLAGGGAGT
jgi:cytosine/adenosine deaminase-related metal-dependent hydrolase